jgi:flagellar biosynthesis protein FliP
VKATLTRMLAAAGVLVCVLVGGPGVALAAPGDPPAVPTPSSGRGAPAQPAGPTGPSGSSGSSGSPGTIPSPLLNVDPKPSNSILIILVLTILSVAPAILLLCTSFTKIFVVLSITRNALGLTSVPPNQVIAGLALFLSLFVMGPVVDQVYTEGVRPVLHSEKRTEEGIRDGWVPLQKFLVTHTRTDEIALMTRAAGLPNPPKPADTPWQTLIPAFILSELRAALIIGFAVYVPFLVIDMVVSASLMSMGMMMLPPVTVSLPFKLLLFVLADGWGLVVTSLVTSYR